MSSEPDVPTSDAKSPLSASSPTSTDGGDSSKMAVRILVSSRMAGGLIGRGGSIIKKFRETSGSWIDIADPVQGATRRVVTVKGPLSKVANALSLITGRLYERSQESKRDEEKGKGTHSITFLVPNQQIGALIGKGGAQIKQTRQASNASIKVSEKPLEQSTEKTVVIEGTAQQVEIAVERILNNLLASQDRAIARILFVPRPSYNYSNMNPLALGGPNNVNMASLAGVNGLGANPLFNPNDPFGVNSNPFAGVGGGLNLNSANFAALAGNTAGGLPAGFGGAASGNVGGFDPSQFGPAAHQTVVIPVPDCIIGSVIGRHGATIKDIRTRSRSQIKIAAPDNPGAADGDLGDRLITITGPRQCNEIAVALIYEKLNSYDPNYRSKNGNNDDNEDGDDNGDADMMI